MTSTPHAWVLVHLVASTVCRHLLVLLLQLLLQLVGSALVLEYSLIQVSSAVAFTVIIYHDHVVVVGSDHLDVVVLLLLLLVLTHDHAWWEVLLTTAVVLLADDELLALVVRDVRVSLNYLALSCSFRSLLALSLGKLLFALNSWPVDSITNWLSAVTEDWEWVHPRVVSKDLFPIL